MSDVCVTDLDRPEEMDGDADDEDDSDHELADRQPLDLEGSIVVGGTLPRRGSVCSCGTSTSSRSSCSCGESGCEHRPCSSSCSTSRSMRGYTPTRDSVGSVVDDSLPYPGFRPVTLFCLSQTSHPRDWCLRMVNNPWFERLCMTVILLNCVTLGMYRPCADEVCESSRCRILQHTDDLIFGFFAFEMLVKITAMGAFGRNAYLAETWNRLDFFIVIAGSLEYCLDVGNINLSAIRTVRVLRPLRAINRIPSMRILVMLLLDTLPMLGNVLLLCFFVFFIFGIVGVQLWAGILRQRCYIELPPNTSLPGYISPIYYERVKVLNPISTYYQSPEADKDYICSLDKDNGVHRCNNLPSSRFGGRPCNGTALPFSDNSPSEGSCINWNRYYTNCRAGDRNPFQGAISFDNIGLAWVAIFLVISLEGWTDIMYYVQDAHSFWDFIYFIVLIVVGSFFMINLCLVVIATQFSETKKREMERMRIERARFNSTSTLASTNASQSSGCYTQLFKYVAHLFRRGHRKFLRFCRKRRRKNTPEPPLPITLRRRSSKRWQPGQSSLKNNGQSESTCSAGEVAKTPQAPFASPEISDIDLVSSPRDNNGLSVDRPVDRQTEPKLQGGNRPEYICRSISKDAATQRKQSTPSSRTSQLTCAELLAIGATQSAVLAGFNNTFAMQRFHSAIEGAGEKHFSAPQLLFYSPDTADSRLHTAEDYWSEPESEPGSTGPFCRWWGQQQSKVKSFTDHRYFQRGILTAILVNTLSMGIEYHNQPDELTLAVEISNVIFTAIFFLEMILKMFAEGFCNYISSGFNVFDSVIVVLSLVELFQSSGGSGLSVLRTFRLLRILKLVRFLPALRRQLIIMLRTVDNVAVFFALLILFIFIFSILGMNLFGCKFCKKLPDGTTQCDRKNFDTLLWAIVTVFQILTQEDWNVVLFNGMEKTSHWAALYFVALMTFGNYVLFNLLVAILVEGFSAEDDKRDSASSCSLCEKQELAEKWDDPKDNIEKEIKMKAYPYVLTVLKEHCNGNGNGATTNLCFPPVITHTAATPQGSPNATLALQREKALNVTPMDFYVLYHNLSTLQEHPQLKEYKRLINIKCTEDLPCEGLGEHAHFKDFGMAFLTLFRVATGDNWNGIMKDTLRDNCDYSSDCIRNCCVSPLIAPLYFVVFVLMAQFVLVNVVVAVLMKHLEESHKQMDDDIEMDAELEREFADERRRAEAPPEVEDSKVKSVVRSKSLPHKPLVKMASLPPNFVFPFNSVEERSFRRGSLNFQIYRNTTDCVFNRFSLDSSGPPTDLSPSPNINIRQASPDETDSKVSVANLSPVPPRSSFGSNLNVPELRKDQPRENWVCVLSSFENESGRGQILSSDSERADDKAETPADSTFVSRIRRRLSALETGSPTSSDRPTDHSIATDSTSLEC
ncbi:Voltage-dependent T-type calcium channel like protein [Argiope bruennichi]|uniref:Voltage-dependent T-type calcium channel like protein n=1 Tax=Argiope bruennichi TaxID=94029 RepID=A0A8T0FPP3_ARGBR|nr:Voltage-dependent T-type calcium channel like protein [Argiope bruennichi]